MAIADGPGSPWLDPEAERAVQWEEQGLLLIVVAACARDDTPDLNRVLQVGGGE